MRCMFFGLARERFLQAAVDRNDMAGRLGALFAGKPNDGLGAVAGQNRFASQGTLRVELSEFVAKLFGGLRFGKSDLVFLERTDDAIARKHGGAGNDRRGSNA